MTYIFRNHTVERFFRGEYIFSGYDDYTAIPQADEYIWWYQIPYRTDTSKLAEEVASYAEKLKYSVVQINARPFLILTLVKLFDTSCVQSDWQLDEAINAFNNTARQLAEQHPNIKILDFAEFIRRVENGGWAELRGTDAIDWRFYFISQMPLNPRWSNAFESWLAECRQSIKLSRKKCLVLDLDNTLWGGIIGEDGIEKIQMSGDYPGKAYHWWQGSLKQLADSGVILAICSKNNPTDVEQVWNVYPDMPLKKTDFSASRINWNNKADNLIEISQELNIGLDSMVFVDDNPAERELVRQQLPQVEVPDWPSQPYEFPMFYQQLVRRYFRIYELTQEDLQKTQQYRQRAERETEKLRYSSMEDFLKSLEMKLKVCKVNDVTLARVVQMTQKTNQFNLTTHRYTEDDIRRLMNEGAEVWTLAVSDRFGDSGITGLMICKKTGILLKVDTLLLSCRILGKGIEKAFVKAVLGKSMQKNDIVEAEYIPTEKNVQTAGFWNQCGFKLIETHESGIKIYRATFDELNLEQEEYYKVEIE